MGVVSVCAGAGLADVGDVGDGDALDEDGRLEGADELAHVEWVALGEGVASVGAGDGLLADEGGGGHLSAGHAVDGVVDEEDADLLAPVGGLEGLVESDGGEVAVALVGEDDLVGGP